MKEQLPSLIEPEELLHLPKGSYILIDTGPSRERYIMRHLQGALYADLNADLAHVPDDPAMGGRHPLPFPEKFGNVLGQLGITQDSHVIVYDDKNGANPAARFWWMLRAAGHNRVQVLNGRLQSAEKEGYSATDCIEYAKPGKDYNFSHWLLPLVHMAEVEMAISKDDFVVIDVRDKERFDGSTEPIDLVAGHIPGAINIPFVSNLDAGGKFLSPTALREKYTAALAGVPIENVIVHCGSGVTACHTLLALDHAGLGIPKLYVGSWSEWSRNPKAIGRNSI
ncbi:sulfurtransferase [uncultured Flavobacterium sp.]|uniref:sulfurtransferase n=1 Tax=uncultured Flavobacterium sp. TaxID=165435 RepID=UPI0025F57D90|nr:sulfurtransferase [uncultured Flavobacterium sp.]